MEVTKSEMYDYIKSMIGIEINDNTRFFDDVGIDGLDAEQMMIQISEKYGVDLSDYDPSNYHFNEADIANIFPPIWKMIKGKAPKYSSFTALHLYKVVKVRRWFLP
jgi:acyl carrier protein